MDCLNRDEWLGRLEQVQALTRKLHWDQYKFECGMLENDDLESSHSERLEWSAALARLSYEAMRLSMELKGVDLCEPPE